MNRLATWSKLRRLGRGEIVAIYAHRSGSLVWTVAGVLASGAVYLLLDPRYPAPRLAQLLRVARPKAFLALDAAGLPPPEVVEALDELASSTVEVPEIADLADLDLLLGDDPPGDDGVGARVPASTTTSARTTRRA